MNKRYVVILAAGKGTRMKSKLYKVLHEVCGQSMVEHVVNQAEQINPEKIVAVVGHGAAAVEEKLGERVDFVRQSEQLGTGHAVLQAQDLIGDLDGSTLVVNGDTPLLTAATFEKLFAEHDNSGAKATVLTANAPDPTGYGRVVTDATGSVLKIVEQKDASVEEQKITDINTGVFVFDNKALFASLQKVTNDNAQGEYYLTDVMEILRNDGHSIAAFQTSDFDETMGVNDRVALAQANKLMQARINRSHMVNGVSFVDPSTAYIDSTVVIGNDTVIEGNVVIKGNTEIGSNSKVQSGSRIVDSTIGQNVVVTSSTVEGSVMQDNTDIGPNSHLRPGALIKSGAHIGNFVEIKKAVIGENSKVGHLTYVGDANIGKDVNIGCGVVFVNYDGVQKFHSTIGDKCFIGSNSNIISPVTMEDNSFIAAGSTITNDVPRHAMAIARSRQENKADFWDRLPLGHDKNWN